ncbi:aldehyde dehydrogenase family protein [Streptomyces sp. DSM 118878]
MARVEQLTKRALADGARTASGGHRLNGPGYFFAPTVLTDVP